MFSLIILIVVVVFFLQGPKRGGYRRRLEDDLTACAAENILSIEQKNRVLAFVATREPGTKFKGTTWLGIIAGLCVAAGLSLIVAHNWERLGASVRVVGFALLFVAVGEAAMRVASSTSRLRFLALPLDLLWFFLPLIGIGLFAQTFHLSGDAIRPYLVWLAIAAAQVWWSEGKTLPILFVLALLATMGSGNFLVGNDLRLVNRYTQAMPGLLPWGMTLAMWALAAALSRFRFPSGHRRHLIGAFLAWYVCLLMAKTPLQIEHAGWILVAVMSASTLWTMLNLTLDGSNAESYVAGFSWLMTVYGMTFLWHGHPSAFETLPLSSTIPVGILLAASIGSVLVLPVSKLDSSPLWGRLLQAAHLAGLALVLGWVFLGADSSRAIAVGANLLLFAIGAGLLFHGAKLGVSRHINLGVLVLILLILTRFIDVLGSFLRSGIGFVVSGLFFAGLAWLLDRGRKHLLEQSRRDG